MAKDLVEKIEHQIIHTDSLFSVDENFEDARFMRVRIAAMHSGINRNNSRFDTKVIKNAKNTFANIPILADVQEYTDADGNKYLDYSGHSMHIESDAFNEDLDRMIYDEKVVGIVPETNNFEIVTDESTGNDYAYVDALLYRDYGNYVCDILESRGNKTDVSMEIACDEVSFSAKDKCLEVGKMTACAITLLGDHVTPGMAKAHAEVFSSSEDDRQSQLIRIMQELKESLDNYTNLRKEETTKVEDNKELLEEVTETTEEEFEVVEEVAAEETTEEEVTVEEEFSDDTEDVTPEESEETVEEESEEVIEQNSFKYSVSYGENVKEFAVSLSDIMYALSQLVNDTYADEETYYGVEVYAEDKYVIMQDFWTGKAYKQAYKTKKDSYMLSGDRVPVKAVFLTEDEEKALDDMRNNYSSISEQFAELQPKFEEVSTKLEKYESEPAKMEILESTDYNNIAEVEEFVELKKQENHFDLTIEEVTAKADEMLLAYAKNQKIEFAAIETNEPKEVGMKKLPIGNNSTKRSRYGGLGKKED